MRPSQQRPLRLRQLKQKNQSRNRSPKRKSLRKSRRLHRLHRRPGPLRRGSRWVTHRDQQPPDNSRAGRKPLGQRRHRLVRNNRHNRHNRPNLCGHRRPKRRRHSRLSRRSRSGPIRRRPPVLRDKIPRAPLPNASATGALALLNDIEVLASKPLGVISARRHRLPSEFAPSVFHVVHRCDCWSA